MLSKKVSAISRRVSSGLTPLRSNLEFWLDGTIPWLKTEQLGEKYIFSTTEKISEAALRKTSVKVYPPNTLSVAMYGEGKTRGNVSIIKSAMATNQACCNIEIDPELADFEYVYYFLKTQYNELRNLSSGVRKNLNSEDIKNFIIRLPNDLADQKKIASILSSLDAKIDCNNRISEKLESLTKLLYDYWFVQFDFPDLNGNPYKSSGGAMVYNELLKRDIPKDWQAIELSEIISRSGTGLNPRDNFQLGSGSNYYVTIKNVNNGKITLDERCDRISDEALEIIDRRSQLQAGDILFTSIQPVGITYLIHEKPKNWNINESVFAIRPDLSKSTSEYLFFLLSSNQMKVFTKNSSTGSIHKGIRHGVLRTYVSAYGGKSLIDRFSSIVQPTLKQMNVLESENQQLSKFRDWLLPMLMNGQLIVS
jgi:type I restriction enzyme S subunit